MLKTAHYFHRDSSCDATAFDCQDKLVPPVLSPEPSFNIGLVSEEICMIGAGIALDKNPILESTVSI